MIYIIEGIDHVGKDTVIDEMRSRLDYTSVFHSTKPRDIIGPSLKLENYPTYITNISQKFLHQAINQYNYFTTMNKMLESTAQFDCNIILNRYHLGEYVYGNIYRDYKASTTDIIESFESDFLIENSALVLLHLDDFYLREFDDDAINFNKGLDEQKNFLKIFDSSKIKNKKYVNVDIKGRWRNPYDIVNDILK